MGWEVGGSFKREGTYIYLWLIHVDVSQKLIQYCRTIIFQLKTDIFIERKRKDHLPAWALALMHLVAVSLQLAQQDPAELRQGLILSSYEPAAAWCIPASTAAVTVAAAAGQEKLKCQATPPRPLILSHKTVYTLRHRIAKTTWERRTEIQVSYCLISNATTKLQSSKQCGTGAKQIYTSMEQNRQPRNTPTFTRAVNLWQRRQEYTVRKVKLYQ